MEEVTEETAMVPDTRAATQRDPVTGEATAPPTGVRYRLPAYFRFRTLRVVNKTR